MRSKIVGLVVAVGCLPGCHAHHELEAPTSAASIESREAAYEQLKPISYHETHITYLQGGMPVGAAKQVDYLQLADGRRIYYPEDILPVVPEESPAALAAESSRSARTTSRTLQAFGIGGWVVGTSLMVAPLLSTPEPDGSRDLTLLYAGLGVVGVGSIVYLVAMPFRSDAHDEAATAFETYDAGLRDRLGICSPTDRSPECRPKNRRRETPAASTSVAEPAPAPRTAPEGVAGFRFGTDLAQVQEACEKSQHQFEATEPTATCSGLAADLGVPGRASMTFCDGSLCEIEATLETNSENHGRVIAALRRQLNGRYGSPAQASQRSSTCPRALKSCVQDSWRWPSGHAVVLTLALVDGQPTLLLTYSTPQRAASSPGPAL